VITRWRDDIRLYLDGHLQFSSVDEYRYHEALVHPVMSLAERHERVLILGGGDGLVAREVAKYADVRSVEVVDIDPTVTDLFRDNPMLRSLNDEAFDDPRVTVHNIDAMRFLQETADTYDVIIMDLPDPSEPGLGKLYSRAFFGLVGRHLADGGMLAAQCTSPFRARQAYWCIIKTIESVELGPGPHDRLLALPYHTLVPTFGTWGFALVGRERLSIDKLALQVPTRYLSGELLPTLFVFPPDMARVDTNISTLDDPVVCRLYSRGYHQYLD
jgi:spermidine synthase